MALNKSNALLRACDNIGKVRRKPNDSQKIINAATAIADFDAQNEDKGNSFISSILASSVIEILDGRDG